jgi:hypothetical protein
VRNVDAGITAFSLVAPQVVLPQQPGAVPVSTQTEGVTTVRRVLAGTTRPAQRRTHTVTAFSGTASAGIHPV